MSSLLRFLPTARQQKITDDAASTIPKEQVDVKQEQSGDSDSEEPQEGMLSLEERAYCILVFTGL